MKMCAIAAATILAAAAGGAYGDTVSVLDPFQGWGALGMDITTTYAPDLQDGSLEINSTPGNPAMLVRQLLGGGVFGTVGDLQTVNFDWYKDSSSGVGPAETVEFSMWVASNLDISQNTFISWQFDSNSVAATDQWITQSLTLANFTAEDPSLTVTGDWQIFGLIWRTGSSWSGNFNGAIDNVHIDFANGADINYNFEPQVIPLPSAAWAGLGGLALIPIVRRVQRRSK